jgi:hypothetical protein
MDFIKGRKIGKNRDSAIVEKPFFKEIFSIKLLSPPGKR